MELTREGKHRYRENYLMSGRLDLFLHQTSLILWNGADMLPPLFLLTEVRAVWGVNGSDELSVGGGLTASAWPEPGGVTAFQKKTGAGLRGPRIQVAELDTLYLLSFPYFPAIFGV